MFRDCFRSGQKLKKLAMLEVLTVLLSHYSAETYYYLDNLTVDFRAHRLGIGHQLLTEGLEEASRMGLDVSTEASAKGEHLYRKAGFKQVGVWQVEDIVMPVMNWTGRAVRA